MKKKWIIIPLCVITVFLLYLCISKNFIIGSYTISNIVSADEYSYKKESLDNYLPYEITFTVKNLSLVNFEYLKVYNVENEQIIFDFSDSISEYKTGVRPLSKREYSAVIWIRDDVKIDEMQNIFSCFKFSGKLISYKFLSANENKHYITFNYIDGVK